MKTLEQRLENLNDIIKIQCSRGNGDYDQYMHGLANGLIMARSLFTDEEPEFMEAPAKWGKDHPSWFIKLKWKLFPRSMVATSGSQGENEPI